MSKDQNGTYRKTRDRLLELLKLDQEENRRRMEAREDPLMQLQRENSLAAALRDDTDYGKALETGAKLKGDTFRAALNELHQNPLYNRSTTGMRDRIQKRTEDQYGAQAAEVRGAAKNAVPVLGDQRMQRAENIVNNWATRKSKISGTYNPPRGVSMSKAEEEEARQKAQAAADKLGMTPWYQDPNNPTTAEQAAYSMASTAATSDWYRNHPNAGKARGAAMRPDYDRAAGNAFRTVKGKAETLRGDQQTQEDYEADKAFDWWMQTEDGQRTLPYFGGSERSLRQAYDADYHQAGASQGLKTRVVNAWKNDLKEQKREQRAAETAKIGGSPFQEWKTTAEGQAKEGDYQQQVQTNSHDLLMYAWDYLDPEDRESYYAYINGQPSNGNLVLKEDYHEMSDEEAAAFREEIVDASLMRDFNDTYGRNGDRYYAERENHELSEQAAQERIGKWQGYGAQVMNRVYETSKENPLGAWMLWNNEFERVNQTLAELRTMKATGAYADDPYYSVNWNENIDDQITILQNEQKLMALSSVIMEPDFAVRSQPIRDYEGDSNYAMIAGWIQPPTEEEAAAQDAEAWSYEDERNRPLKMGKQALVGDYADYMTSNEKATFFYLYNNPEYGKDAAMDYLYALENEMLYKAANARRQREYQWAMANPVLSSVTDILMTPARGASAAAYMIGNLTSGGNFSPFHHSLDIADNTVQHRAATDELTRVQAGYAAGGWLGDTFIGVNQTWRNMTGQGELTEEDKEGIRQGVAQGLLDLKRGGDSAGDSAMTMVSGIGFSKLLGACMTGAGCGASALGMTAAEFNQMTFTAGMQMSLWWQSAQAGALATANAKETGASDRVAALQGIAHFVAEHLTETVGAEGIARFGPLSSALKGSGHFVAGNMVLCSVAEGLEEVGSGIFSMAADRLLNTSESDWDKKRWNYYQEHQEEGISLEQADIAVGAEFAGEVATEAIVTALTTGPTTAGNMMMNKIGTNAQASQAVAELREQGLLTDEQAKGAVRTIARAMEAESYIQMAQEEGIQPRESDIVALQTMQGLREMIDDNQSDQVASAAFAAMVTDGMGTQEGQTAAAQKRKAEGWTKAEDGTYKDEQGQTWKPVTNEEGEAVKDFDGQQVYALTDESGNEVRDENGERSIRNEDGEELHEYKASEDLDENAEGVQPAQQEQKAQAETAQAQQETKDQNDQKLTEIREQRRQNQENLEKAKAERERTLRKLNQDTNTQTGGRVILTNESEEKLKRDVSRLDHLVQQLEQKDQILAREEEARLQELNRGQDDAWRNGRREGLPIDQDVEAANRELRTQKQSRLTEIEGQLQQLGTQIAQAEQDIQTLQADIASAVDEDMSQIASDSNLELMAKQDKLKNQQAALEQEREQLNRELTEEAQQAVEALPEQAQETAEQKAEEPAEENKQAEPRQRAPIPKFVRTKTDLHSQAKAAMPTFTEEEVQNVFRLIRHRETKGEMSEADKQALLEKWHRYQNAQDRMVLEAPATVDGRAAKVIGIESVGEDARVIIEQDNQRSTVPLDSDDLKFASMEQAAIYKMACGMTNARVAGLMLAAWERSKLNPDTFQRAFTDMYRVGRENLRMNQANRVMAELLGKDIAQVIRQAGHEAMLAEDKETYGRENLDKLNEAMREIRERNTSADNYKGVVLSQKLHAESMSADQKAGVQMLDYFGRDVGLRIVVVPHLLTKAEQMAVEEAEKGKQAPKAGIVNGEFIDGTNTIIVALDSIEGAIVNHAGHESWHWVKNQAAKQGGQLLAEAQAFENEIIDRMQKNDPNYNLEQRIAEKIQQYKDQGVDLNDKKMFPEGAEAAAKEELVAQAVMTLMGNITEMQMMQENHPSILKKIVNGLKYWAKKIRDTIKRLGYTDGKVRDAEVAAMLSTEADQLEALAGKYYDLMKRIGKNQQLQPGKNSRAYSLSNEELQDMGIEAPEQVLYSLAGEHAQGEYAEIVRRANEMARQGKTAEEIRKATGAVQGFNGRWWAKIDNRDMRYDPDDTTRSAIWRNIWNGGWLALRLSDIYKADALYKAYPQLRDVQVSFRNMGKEAIGMADFDNGTPYLQINRQVLNELDNAGENIATVIEETLQHEIQHIIQHYEGSNTGASVVIWDQIKAAYEQLERQMAKDQYALYDAYGYDFMDSIRLTKDFRLDESAYTQEELDELRRTVPAEDLQAWADIMRFYDKYHNMAHRDSFELYKNTVGEIEAFSQEERGGPQTPNYRNAVAVEDYVDMETGAVRYSISGDNESTFLRDQIKAHAPELEKLGVVGSVSTEIDLRPYYRRGARSNEAAIRMWAKDIADDLQRRAYRDDLGRVVFSNASVSRGLSYIALHNMAQVAALKLAPEVISQGIVIEDRPNHKGRKIRSITYAARVEIDGEPGDMGVIVHVDRGTNTYKTHKVLLPDGTEFVINGKETEAGNYTEHFSETGAPAVRTTSVSDTSVPKNQQGSNGQSGQSGEVKYSFSDAEYMDAVRHGDTLKAADMVAEAARRAGYDLRVYHQTKAEFNRFNTDNESAGQYDDETPTGLFFKTTPEDIGLEGKKQMGLFIRSKRMLEFANREAIRKYWEKHVPGYKELRQQMDAEDRRLEQEYLEIDGRWDAYYDEHYDGIVANDPTVMSELDAISKEGEAFLTRWHDQLQPTRRQLKELINGYVRTEDFDGIHLVYDGKMPGYPAVETYIVFDPTQVKSARPVTYDDQGKVIPLSQRFNREEGDIRYSLAEDNVVRSDNGQELAGIQDGGVAVRYSWSSYTPAEREKVRNFLLKQGFEEADVDGWLRNMDTIAAIIGGDRARLDYTPDRDKKAKKPNGEVYKWTIDFSTLCPKRLLFQGTFDYIQDLIPNTGISAEWLIRLNNIMQEMGYQAPCSFCYVEGQRKHGGEFAAEFVERYKKKHPNGYMPTVADLTTSTGLWRMQTEHPEVYKSFISSNNARGVSSTKPIQLRTDYRSEIRRMGASTIKYLNEHGGLRIQSFSDFETLHLLDMMQVVTDMAGRRLKSQAYTKVADFAWVFGKTGIKINLSLVGEGTGLDANGKLIFSSTEGMDFEEAMRLRDAYSYNVGTILVGISREHILAAMADDRIDFIIPFHRSNWSAEDRQLMAGMRHYDDFQAWQNEGLLVQDKDGNFRRGNNVKDNIQPEEYWDTQASGKENAERYLAECARRGIVPKFEIFLHDNGNGTWSLQEDGSTDGYWKLLIDYKMYDNEGNNAPQLAVTPDFNMEEAQRILNEKKGRSDDALPVAHDVVERFLREYNRENPENTDAQAAVERGRFSISDADEGISLYGIDETDPAMEQLLQENEQFRTLTAQLAAELNRQELRNNGQLLSKANMTRMARYLRDNWKVKLPIGTMTENMTKIFTALTQARTVAEAQTAMQALGDFAADAIMHAQVTESHNMELYQEVRSWLRSVHTSRDVIMDVYGDMESYRHNGFGTIRMNRRNETSNVDQIYSEMLGVLGNVMREDLVNDADQLAEMLRVLDSLAPRVYNPYEEGEAAAYGSVVEVASRDLAMRLLQNYADGGVDRKATGAMTPVQTDRLTNLLRQANGIVAQANQQGRSYMGQTEREYQKQIAALRQKMQAQGDKLRQKVKDAVRKEHDRMAGISQAERDRRNATELRNKTEREILRRKGSLLKKLQHPNSSRGFVPYQMEEAVLALLEAVDTEGDLSGKPNQPLTAALLQKAKDAYESINKQGPEDARGPMASYYNGDLVNSFDELIRKADGKRVRDLTQAELEHLRDIVAGFSAAVINADRMFTQQRSDSLHQMGGEMIEEAKDWIQTHGEEKVQGPLAEWVGRATNRGLLKPVTVFERFNGTVLGEIWKNALRPAEWQHVRNIRQAERFLNDALDTYHQHESLNADGSRNQKRQEFRLDSGRTIRLTDQELMTIYALQKREALTGTNHLLGGGITLANKQRGDTLEEYRLTADDLQQFNAALNQEQKAFVDHMVEFLSTTVGEWGNAVTRELYGIEKFRETYYLPIKVNESFVEKMPASQQDARLKVGSFTKTLTKNASNTVEIAGFIELWASHVEQMSDFNAFVLPMEDLTRLLNYKEGAYDDQGNFIGQGDNVRPLLERGWGRNSVKYIQDFLSRLNGNSRGEEGDAWLNKTMSKTKGAAVTWNLSVAFQQAGAGIRAMAEMDARDVLPTLITGIGQNGGFWKNYEELMKYAPIAVEKSWGYFDTNMKRGLYQRAQTTLRSRLDDAGGWLAGKGDELNWSQIWAACKHEIRRLNPNMTEEEVKQHAAERFVEVIDRTQVVDSIFQRSAFATEKGMMKHLVSFMSEPITMYNMIVRSVDQLRYAYRAKDATAQKAAWGKAVKTNISIILSSALTALFASIAKAPRDRDNEKKDENGNIIGNRSFADKIVEAWLPNLGDNLLGLFTIFGRMYDNATGNSGNSDLTTTWITNIWNAGKEILKGEDADWEKVAYRSTQALSNLTGIGFAGLYREVKSAFLTVNEIMDPESLSGTAWDRSKSWDVRMRAAERNYAYTKEHKGAGMKVKSTYYTDWMVEEYMENGFSDDFQLIADTAIRMGATEDGLKGSFEDKLKLAEPMVQKAAQALKDGDLQGYNQAMQALQDGGIGEKSANSMVKKAYNALVKPEETKEPGTGAGLVEALQAEDTSTNAPTKKVGDDLLTDNATQEDVQRAVQMYKSAGMTDEKIAEKVSGKYKKPYILATIRGDKTESSRIGGNLKAGGITQDQMKSWTTEDVFSNTKDTGLYWMIREGKTDDAKAAVKYLNLNYPGGQTKVKEKILNYCKTYLKPGKYDYDTVKRVLLALGFAESTINGTLKK